MAAVIPRAFNGKGVVIDSAGFDMTADGGNHTLIRTENGIDHRGIGLRTSCEEEYLRIG